MHSASISSKIKTPRFFNTFTDTGRFSGETRLVSSSNRLQLSPKLLSPARSSTMRPIRQVVFSLRGVPSFSRFCTTLCSPWPKSPSPSQVVQSWRSIEVLHSTVSNHHYLGGSDPTHTIIDPAAFCIAQITADIPVLFFQVSIFSIVLYFMVGLETSASAFFTYWVIVFTTAICMTALFRLIGAAFGTFDGASKVSGFAVMAFIMYTGYMIHKPSMHPWFVWIYWIVSTSAKPLEPPFANYI
jgi:hypothetical protein